MEVEKRDTRSAPREQNPAPAETKPSNTRARGFCAENPKAKWVLLAVGIVALIGVAIMWSYYSTRESTDDAQVDGHLGPVSARVSGTAIRVLVDDNQMVQAGTLLAELDPKDYQVAVQRARADLADAQANAVAAGANVPLTSTTTSSQLTAANAGVGAAQKDIGAAKAKVQEALANYTKAAADLKRMEELVQKDEISRQQYDASVAAAASAKATLDAAISAEAAAEAHAVHASAAASGANVVPEQIRVTSSKAASANAQVEKYKAMLDQAEP